ncbi:MAG TPA: hypothetical protein VIX13_06285, partial [Candidatus Eisenbacteria bacterium]
MDESVAAAGSGIPPAEAPRAPVVAAAGPVPSVPRITLQVLGLILAAAALLWILRRIEGVLLLLILSIFFAYLIAPLVALLRRPIVLRNRTRTLPLPA